MWCPLSLQDSFKLPQKAKMSSKRKVMEKDSSHSL